MKKEIIDYFEKINLEENITISRISKDLKVSERRAREIISQMRQEPTNYIIVSDPHYEGFFKTQNIYTIERFVNQMESRISEIEKAILFAKNILKNK